MDFRKSWAFKVHIEVNTGESSSKMRLEAEKLKVTIIVEIK